MNISIEKNTDKKEMTIAVSGSIDTVTAPELEIKLNAESEGFVQITLDFSAVDYVSSAGLRVLMSVDRKMSERAGTLRLKNLADDVREVFEMTGFDELLSID